MPRILFAIILLFMPAAVLGSTIKSVMPDAELRGVATFRYLGFPLYEARLFTNDADALDWREDFGIELRYLRNLTRQDLVEGTMRELSRTGAPSQVRAQLNQCFADVDKGDRFLAVSRGEDQVSFWLNGSRTCTLRYPDIKTRFMAIFVGDNTRSRNFTRKLKGE
ncbi:hypothetical protein [Shimia sp. SDUM112013]|uniref:hypothetical protein n=1 Tax=Shimia sp. SDUM112013 TaxID=3136160 RepID=UPI0032EC0C56